MSEQPADKGRRAALAFILVTVWIDVLSFGVTIPVFPKLFENFMHGDVARAAAAIGVLMTLWSAIQFFMAPVLGALSDRFGRRSVILFSNLGTGMDFLIMAVAPSVGWLFLGRILNAVTAASFSAANAYVADVTPPEERARSFGYIGAAFSFGFIVGPAIGGLLGQIDLRLPFYAGAALGFANFCYGFFVLPESLPAARRRKFELRRANPLGALRFLRADKALFGLAGVFFLMQLAHNLYPSIWVLYTAERYDWTPLFVGLTLAASGGLSMAVSGLMVGPIVARIGERAALLTGLASWFGALLTQGFAWTTALFLAGMPFGALSGLSGPSLNALATRRVGPTHQGEYQGATSSLMSITGLIGPALFTGSFAYSVGPGRGMVPPGLPFFISATLLACAFALALRATRFAALSAPAARTAA
jgi:DHA1 family tetracycline resistance protein-like MFS transporter